MSNVFVRFVLCRLVYRTWIILSNVGLCRIIHLCQSSDILVLHEFSTGKKQLASRFNLTYRYIDDELSINNLLFENCLGQMYPAELEIKDTSTIENITSASNVDLLLSIGMDGQLHTSIYEKQDDLNFHITKFSFLSSIFFIFGGLWPTDQTLQQFHDPDTKIDLHRIISAFHGAFATGVVCQQRTLTLPDAWFRTMSWALAYATIVKTRFPEPAVSFLDFSLECPSVLSRFCVL